MAESAKDRLHNLAVHICEPEVPSLELENQLRVIDPQQVQDGGLQIVNVNRGPTISSGSSSRWCVDRASGPHQRNRAKRRSAQNGPSRGATKVSNARGFPTKI